VLRTCKVSARCCTSDKYSITFPNAGGIMAVGERIHNNIRPHFPRGLGDAIPDAGGSLFQGDHFAFFRSSYITWTRASRPDEAALVLSPSLHSRRHHRKLRTSFPRGACPTEIQPIRSGNFPAARLNRQATASGLCAWHRKRIYMRTCVHACVRELAMIRQQRSSASDIRTRLFRI